jgi:hypothetical protein
MASGPNNAPITAQKTGLAPRRFAIWWHKITQAMFIAADAMSSSILVFALSGYLIDLSD